VERAFLPAKKTIFTLHIRTPDQERRPSARRGNQTHTQRRPAFADGSRFVPQIRLPAPRLAHASRSWSHVVRSLWKTTFPLYKRTFPRAAGVSPPWVGKLVTVIARVIYGRLRDML